MKLYSFIWLNYFLESHQIRGEERVIIAEQCILQSNGSANAFVKQMISDCELARQYDLNNINTNKPLLNCPKWS